MLITTALVIGGLVLLTAGAEILVRGSVALSLRLGVTPLVIGLTVVAFSTSLPELATSVMASVKGEADVAFGNVIGSNILNILCVLGVAALIRPFKVQGLRPLDMGVLVGSAALILPLLWRGYTLNRWEGATLLTGYIAYLYSLVS